MSSRQKCPKCRKSAIAEYKPFCSKRCADDDLAAWITEKYRVASEEENKDVSRDDEDSENLH